MRGLPIQQSPTERGLHRTRLSTSSDLPFYRDPNTRHWFRRSNDRDSFRVVELQVDSKTSQLHDSQLRWLASRNRQSQTIATTAAIDATAEPRRTECRTRRRPSPRTSSSAPPRCLFAPPQPSRCWFAAYGSRIGQSAIHRPAPSRSKSPSPGRPRPVQSSGDVALPSYSLNSLAERRESAKPSKAAIMAGPVTRLLILEPRRKPRAPTIRQAPTAWPSIR